ncbi:MAG TPA: hypothetical protein VGD40_10120 [Chryseosolibacter sp.]
MEKPLKIVTNEGFFERFAELRGQNHTLSMVEIYNMVEDEYLDLVGKNKFSSYDSFRNSRKYFDTKQDLK